MIIEIWKASPSQWRGRKLTWFCRCSLYIQKRCDWHLYQLCFSSVYSPVTLILFCQLSVNWWVSQGNSFILNLQASVSRHPLPQASFSAYFCVIAVPRHNPIIQDIKIALTETMIANPDTNIWTEAAIKGSKSKMLCPQNILSFFWLGKMKVFKNMSFAYLSVQTSP